MLDPRTVLDRFGDEDFLRELWLRARAQLPAERALIDEAIVSGESLSSPEIGKRLHRLRGLIANFLEGGAAIAELRDCEEKCRQGALTTCAWSAFESALEEDSRELETWLAERGYPCA